MSQLTFEVVAGQMVRGEFVVVPDGSRNLLACRWETWRPDGREAVVFYPGQLAFLLPDGVTLRRGSWEQDFIGARDRATGTEVYELPPGYRLPN